MGDSYRFEDKPLLPTDTPADLAAKDKFDAKDEEEYERLTEEAYQEMEEGIDALLADPDALIEDILPEEKKNGG